MNWKHPVRSAVRLALGDRRVRSLVHSELRRPGRAPPMESSGIRRTFIDRRGHRYLLDASLRGRLKPGWPTMVDPYVAVAQRPRAIGAGDLDDQQARLADIRERARLVAGAATGLVEFVEDDVTRTTLRTANIDAIVSFEVLEHVRHPDRAFAGMARLLRPGGLMVHDYNPIFSVNGGHSLCTLAFPWGHARLDRDDFARDVRELRPLEVDQAIRFYGESLNRMTQDDLRDTITGAGLELVGLFSWYDRGLIGSLDPDVVDDVRRLYPTVELGDLLATFETVIARQPSRVGASASPAT